MRKRRREPSELEGFVLGLVHTVGPCTPYAVRRVLRESPNPNWGHSAGSIYPLVRRLAAAGWLSARAHATGERRGLRYAITAEGRRALTRWLGPSANRLATSLPVDPLRTRVRFLAALPGTQRVAFLKDAETQMRGQLGRAERAARNHADPWDVLMSEGAIATIRVRLEWIRSVRARVARWKP